MGKSLFRKFWKSLWVWFLKRHTEWSGVRVRRGRRATKDAQPWPETTDPDIRQNWGGEEPTNKSTTISTWVNGWISLKHLKNKFLSAALNICTFNDIYFKSLIKDFIIVMGNVIHKFVETLYVMIRLIRVSLMYDHLNIFFTIWCKI